MIFWFIIAIVTLIIALVCFYPLLTKQTPQNDNQREQINKALYFNRLQEIKNEQQQGLVDNSAQLQTELQQRLLDDLPMSSTYKSTQSTPFYSKIWFISATLGLAMIAVVTYFQVGAWQMEVMFNKSHQKLPYFYQRLKQEATQPLSATEMQQFATALRMELQEKPDNSENWWLLGQLGMALNNAQLAYDSYGRALKLQPNNVEYQLAYVNILNNSDDPQDKAEANALLKQIIRQDHRNPQALSLLALQYFEQENYQSAVASWQMMLEVMEKNDPKRALIEKSLQTAQEMLAKQQKANQKEDIKSQ
ncbi:MAG: c-type cytochrome biogenesis protein CcmI [Pasteurellaceae bacterium]|nr:c-type cytochrome biogenesis protein CcmI [Pasteurellaceae bacterium]